MSSCLFERFHQPLGKESYCKTYFIRFLPYFNKWILKHHTQHLYSRNDDHWSLPPPPPPFWDHWGCPRHYTNHFTHVILTQRSQQLSLLFNKQLQAESHLQNFQIAGTRTNRCPREGHVCDAGYFQQDALFKQVMKVWDSVMCSFRDSQLNQRRKTYFRKMTHTISHKKEK